MGERQRPARPEDMATTSTAVATISPPVQEDVEPVAVITLRPTAPKEARKKVVWTEDTVDNEHMNKKKSKCCCIYEKPRRFDESDSEASDDECEHCYGHVERRHHHNHHHQPAGEQPASLTINETEETVTEVPTATISLQPPEPARAPPDKAHPTS